MTDISPLERGLRDAAIVFAFLYLQFVAVDRIISGPGTTWYWRRIKNRRGRR